MSQWCSADGGTQTERLYGTQGETTTIVQRERERATGETSQTELKTKQAKALLLPTSEERDSVVVIPSSVSFTSIVNRDIVREGVLLESPRERKSGSV
jgi:hypothetical protein